VHACDVKLVPGTQLLDIAEPTLAKQLPTMMRDYDSRVWAEQSQR
jgi:hypothetical protein